MSPAAKTPSPRGVQLAVHDDRAGAVEVELATDELGVGHAGDLHDEAAGRDPPPPAVGVARSTTASRCSSPSSDSSSQPGRSSMRGSCADLLDDVVAGGERGRSVSEGDAEPARASSRASSVALSPPPMTTTSRPAKRSRAGFQLVRDVAAEGAVGRRRQLLAARAHRQDEHVGVQPVAAGVDPTLDGVDARRRRATARSREPRIAADPSSASRSAGPSAKRPAATLRTEWGISASWPPGRAEGLEQHRVELEVDALEGAAHPGGAATDDDHVVLLLAGHRSVRSSPRPRWPGRRRRRAAGRRPPGARATRAGAGPPGHPRSPATPARACTGMSMWRTPRWLSASTTAFCTAGMEPIVPDSPMPLAPSGLSGVGVSVFRRVERRQLGRRRHARSRRAWT